MKQMIYTIGRKREVLANGNYKGINYVIFSLGYHPTAYIQIPSSHVLHSVNYRELYEKDIDFPVHGGITWSGYLPGCEDELITSNITGEPSGFWYGWDYAHLDDYSAIYAKYPSIGRQTDKKWTTEEIFEEVKAAIDYLLTLK